VNIQSKLNDYFHLVEMCMFQSIGGRLGFSVVVLALIVGSLASTVYAVDNAGASFEGGLGVASYALGNSGVATVKDGSSVIWNPAGLASLSGKKVELQSHQAFETQFLGGLISGKVNGWGVGLGVLNSSVGDIKTVTHEGGRSVDTGERFGSDTLGVWLGLAKRVGAVNVGGSAKVLYERLDGHQATGVGMDLGLQYKPLSWLDLGVTAVNVVKPVMKWDTESGIEEGVPFSLRPGIGVSLGDVLLTTQLDIRDHRPSMMSWGIGYRIQDFITLRAGHNARALSLGTGLVLGGFTLDVAWSKFDEESVPDVYRLGVGFGW
jgi:hypothetical protein